SRQVEPVGRREAPEGALAGLHHIEGRAGRDPEVLGLVRGRADHWLLEDAVGGAVLRVGRAPRARTPELRARARSGQPREVRRAAAPNGEERGRQRPAQGSTRSTAAPPRVATCSAGGSTIVSSWMRITLSSGMPWPPRIAVRF